MTVVENVTTLSDLLQKWPFYDYDNNEHKMRLT
jgi:hypothetical protein